MDYIIILLICICGHCQPTHDFFSRGKRAIANTKNIGEPILESSDGQRELDEYKIEYEFSSRNWMIRIVSYGYDANLKKIIWHDKEYGIDYQDLRSATISAKLINVYFICQDND